MPENDEASVRLYKSIHLSLVSSSAFRWVGIAGKEIASIAREEEAENRIASRVATDVHFCVRAYERRYVHVSCAMNQSIN